jgi:hypothetical protein
VRARRYQYYYYAQKDTPHATALEAPAAGGRRTDEPPAPKGS